MTARDDFGACTPNPGGVDPLWTLWHALGGPVPAAPMDRVGRCARCASMTDHGSRVKVVVSDKFTGWDKYTQDADPIWCVPCTWAHTAREARTKAWRVGGSRVVEATAEVLAEDLSSPLPQKVAVVVPLSRQKHILPAAIWGRVTVDDRRLLWSSDEVFRLDSVRWLRAQGFSEAALGEPVPRFEQLARVTPALMHRVMIRWDNLAAWRKDPAYLQLAFRATRSPRAVDAASQTPAQAAA